MLQNLIVTRREGETIVFEEDGKIKAIIRLTVIRRGKSRVSIRAPSSIVISRGELRPELEPKGG